MTPEARESEPATVESCAEESSSKDGVEKQMTEDMGEAEPSGPLKVEARRNIEAEGVRSLEDGECRLECAPKGCKRTPTGESGETDYLVKIENELLNDDDLELIAEESAANRYEEDVEDLYSMEFSVALEVSNGLGNSERACW